MSIFDSYFPDLRINMLGRNIDKNAHWYTYLHEAANGIYYRGHTLGAIGSMWGSHGGAVSPGFMMKVDAALQGRLGDCEIFVDAGCGIGTALGYVAKQYRKMKILGLELEASRVEAAWDILTGAGINTDGVSIVLGDFTDPTNWESFLNGGEKHKLCVWFNSINFEESAVLMFQEIAEGSMTEEGSVIVSNRRLFMGRTRRTTQGDKFDEEEVTITVDDGDLSWTKQDQKLYVYYRKSDDN